MSKRKGWELLLEQHDKLVQQSNAGLYDRVKILAKVFEDSQFGKDMLKLGQTAEQRLHECVTDTCANFTELYQMLKLFPKRNQWQSSSLSQMRTTMLATLREKNKGKKEEKGPRRRGSCTIAEFQRLQDENNMLKQKIEHLESELKLAREMIDTLKERSPKKRVA